MFFLLLLRNKKIVFWDNHLPVFLFKKKKQISKPCVFNWRRTNFQSNEKGKNIDGNHWAVYAVFWFWKKKVSAHFLHLSMNWENYVKTWHAQLGKSQLNLSVPSSMLFFQYFLVKSKFHFFVINRFILIQGNIVCVSWSFNSSSF